jgi:hypothetical protein
MNVKQRQLIAILAALCWIFAQNISLDHQFTSEHLSQTDSHICLSFANDNDDVLVASSVTTELIEQNSCIFVNHSANVESSFKLSFNARAPPLLFS